MCRRGATWWRMKNTKASKIDAAWEKYLRARRAAAEEYNRARDEAWAEYQRAEAQAFEEYDRADAADRKATK